SWAAIPRRRRPRSRCSPPTEIRCPRSRWPPIATTTPMGGRRTIGCASCASTTRCPTPTAAPRSPARCTRASPCRRETRPPPAGALDGDLAATVAAGYSGDLGVQLHHGNHACWRWLHGDVREYLDTSDLHALIAPRPLVVETGRDDATFSDHLPPYTADLEVL